MNRALKDLENRNRAELDVELQRIAREQSVGRFNFDEAIKDSKGLVTDKELEDFLEWREEVRRIESEAQEWQS